MKLLCLLILLITSPCYAGTKPIYGTDGEYKGFAKSDGDNVVYFGQDGEYEGFSKDNERSRFNEHGEYEGSAHKSDRNTIYYDENGSYTDYSQDPINDPSAHWSDEDVGFGEEDQDE